MKRNVCGVTLLLTLANTGISEAARHAAKSMHHAAAQSPNPTVGATIAAILWFPSVIATYWLAKARHHDPNRWTLAAAAFWFLPALVLLFMSPGDYVSPEAKLNAQQAERERRIGQTLAEIQSGHITPFIPQGVMPQPNEQFFWEQRAQYGQTMKHIAHRGTNPAMYVPLGHGVRMRVGGYQGTSQTASNFAWGPTGTVFISNQRLLFKADTGDVANAPFSEIITYDTFPDGLGLNVHKIGVMQFKTGDELLGAVFLKVVQAPLKSELTTTT